MVEDIYPQKMQFVFGGSPLTAWADRVDSTHSNVLRLTIVRSSFHKCIATVLRLLPLPKVMIQFFHKLAVPHYWLPSRVIHKAFKPDWDDEFDNEKTLYKRLAPLQGRMLPTFLGDAEYKGSPAILLSYVDGTPSHRQSASAAISAEEFKRQVEAILWAFTEFGIAYGDAKLDNFIVSSDGRVTLVDLEQADEVEEEHFKLAVTSLSNHATSQDGAHDTESHQCLDGCLASRYQSAMTSRSINDGFLVRWAVIILHYLLSVRCFSRLFQRAGPVIFLPRRLCVKSTFCTSLAEASAMRFIAEHTSVPVPKVYSAFDHKGKVYIVMERIDGEMLARGWRQRTPESRSRVLESLRSMIQQMRRIPAPAGCGVSNVDGGPIYDGRLPGDSFWGPFPTIHGFHRKLRADVDEPAFAGVAIPELGPLIAFHNQPWPDLVFSHGDLSPLNILARGDEIVGIVDWETAAWMPPYWEYTSAWNVNPQTQFWQPEVDHFLDSFPEALEMEGIRRKYNNDY